MRFRVHVDGEDHSVVASTDGGLVVDSDGFQTKVARTAVDRRLVQVGDRSYQVNDELFAKARPDAVFMHCLPAKRGEEVTDSVIECSRSVVFEQAENRLHAQKALLLMMLS